MHFISQTATSPSPARDTSPARDYPKPWMSGARYFCSVSLSKAFYESYPLPFSLLLPVTNWLHS